MPQVYNKSLATEDDPLMVIKAGFTDKVLRRINSLNSQEERKSHVQLGYISGQCSSLETKYQKMRKLMMEKLHKNIAYKLVLWQHGISDLNGYNNAAIADHTIDALQNEVKQMVEWMQPGSMKERKARAMITENRRRYEAILRRNKERSAEWLYSENHSGTVDSDAEKDRNDLKDKQLNLYSILPNINSSSPNVMPRLRHSVGSTCNGQQKQPTRPSSANNAQAITMYMMKIQGSFIKVKEKQQSFIEQGEAETPTTKQAAIASSTHNNEGKTSGKPKEKNADDKNVLVDRKTRGLQLTQSRNTGLGKLAPKAGLDAKKFPTVFQKLCLSEPLPAIV